MSRDNPLAGRRVLLVEDEMIVAWLLEDTLADLGCVVVGPAGSINQALAMIDKAAFDAVLLDINLNGKMSYPVADVLAARGIPFVFSTAYAKDRILDSYQQFPMLQKPFHRTELGAMLVKLLTSNEPSAASASARGNKI